MALAIALLTGDLRPAGAHAIESSLERLADLQQQLQLETRFSTGVPVEGAAVRLVPPNGGEGVLVGRTDALGQLRFRLPGGVDPAWEVQVDGGAGHRDYLELPAASPRTSGSPTALSGPRPGLRPAPLLAAALLGLVSTTLLRRRR